jgi:tetratricopeptide (TPR) repeat protein
MTGFRVILLATLICGFASALPGHAESWDMSESNGETTPSEAKPQIELGFSLLYSLKFDEARRQFEAWQKMNPEDPLGYVAMAASYLFEEFNEHHVLTSQFFLDDNRLLGGIPEKADKVRVAKFNAANQRGKELALKHISKNPGDTETLFALAAANGLQADFEAILEKHAMKSLSLTRKAEGYASQLLALQPDATDAWFCVGAANYIIGSLPAYKRFFLWFGGIHGDKRLGMEQMSITAERGHYLKPFAEIFVALASIREHQEDVARKYFRDLAARFPDNPLYQTELTRLGGSNAISKNGGH